MPENVEAWWARRQWSKGRRVPYEIGTYRSEWERYPVLIRQYHPDLNRNVVLTQIPPAAEVYLTWQCDTGHVFVATPEEQRNRPGATRRRSSWCPDCLALAAPKRVVNRQSAAGGGGSGVAAEPRASAGLGPAPAPAAAPPVAASRASRTSPGPGPASAAVRARASRASRTAVPGVAGTAVSGASRTVVPGVAGTTVSGASSTVVPGEVGTAVSGAFRTVVPGASPTVASGVPRTVAPGAVRAAAATPRVERSAASRAVPTTVRNAVGEAFHSGRAPKPASAAEGELRARLGERIDLDLRAANAVAVARPFFTHREVWPDILLPELRVAIEYDTIGKFGLEHVGTREATDRRKDRLLREVGWEVIRVRCGKLQPLGEYDLVAGGVTAALVERVIDRLREIRGDLFVNAYLK